MSAGTAVRVSVVILAAAMLQVVVVSSITLGPGSADLLLVTVVAVALLRGSIAGGFAGFAGGVVVDLATLDTLGVSSLVLTLAGFWAGRYGETTARGRRVPPLVAVGAITVLAAGFAVVLRFLLGEEVVVEHALVTTLAPALVLNLAIALPVFALVRALVHERPGAPVVTEVELVA